MNFAEELSNRLRAWPRTMQDDMNVLVRESLSACRAIFGASKAVAVWEEREEPGVTCACDDDAGFRLQELDDAEGDRLVEGRSLFFDDGSGTRVDRGIRERIGPASFVAVPVDADQVEGWLFVVEPQMERAEALCTASAVAAMFAFHVDAVRRCNALRAGVAAEERMKVARDLHDGLLQSFTGVVLQLETVHALLSADSEEAGRLLTQVQASIMADQRELRAYVEGLRPRRRGELTFDFGGRLREMKQRFEEQWRIGVEIDSGDVDPHVHGMLGQETFRIVQEAVTNAARHGGATRVDVRLRTGEGMLVVDVRDNGGGLPVRGTLTLAEMVQKGIGPASLGERITALNGDLTAESTDQGLSLRIAVPLGWSAG